MAAEAHAHEKHPDHASWWPVMLSVGALLAGLGISGLSTSYSVWPFLFAIPVFVASIALHGTRRDGFAPIHGVYVAAAFPLLAVFLIVFHLHHGVVDGFVGANKYFWLALAGASWGVYSLVGMGYESFFVPEPDMAEQWPFDSVENGKLGMWIFLGSDIVLFGGFIGAYIFTRLNFGWQDWWHAAEDPELHMAAEQALEHHPVLPGLINTYLLLASSFTVVLALVFARRGRGELSLGPLSIRNQSLTIGFLAATFLGAAAFLLNKGIEWVDLYIHQHWTFNADIMASTFYLTTGLHAAHVVVGMLIMLFLIGRAYTGAYIEGDADTIEYFGLYWHFVDIVWLFLFPLFYIL
ncbi:hypothetical protein BRC65_06150 [Halobacteriales archaeon QH_2_65_14]|nr:MAG: hypothetical protein BRC65_06150 [Halobacteriales archaeon QH_2_65_14]